jgi:hypothetical protein
MSTGSRSFRRVPRDPQTGTDMGLAGRNGRPVAESRWRPRASAPLSTARSSARPVIASASRRALPIESSSMRAACRSETPGRMRATSSRVSGPSSRARLTAPTHHPGAGMIYSPFTGLCDASTAGRRPDRRATVELSPVEQQDTAIGASAVLLRRSAAARPDRRTPNRGENLHALRRHLVIGSSSSSRAGCGRSRRAPCRTRRVAPRS